MVLSIIAIIIALFSVLWNVVSSIYSWKKAKPLVKVEWFRSALRQDDEKMAPWFNVVIRNIGGAPISVTSIDLWRKLDGGSGEPSARGITLGALEADDKKYSGPVLSYTISPNHSQRWGHNVGFYTNMFTSPPTPDSLTLEVTLGTGEKLERQVPITDVFDRSFFSTG